MLTLKIEYNKGLIARSLLAGIDSDRFINEFVTLDHIDDEKTKAQIHKDFAEVQKHLDNNEI